MIIQYGIIGWGTAYNTNISPLNILQKKIIKICLKKPMQYPSDLLRSVQMLKREQCAESNRKLQHLFIHSKTATSVPEFAVEDLPLDKTATLVPAFAVKDLPMGTTHDGDEDDDQDDNYDGDQNDDYDQEKTTMMMTKMIMMMMLVWQIVQKNSNMYTVLT